MMVGPGALLALCSLLFSVAQGALVNRTIDDWFGDSETGTRPVFLPTGTTWKDEQCTDCAINPDTTRAFRSTYNAATAGKGNDPVTMTMDFEGTAIYVFFILFNNQGSGITTETQARFSIDGGSSTTFSHEPDSTRNVLFNQLVFSRTGLSNGRHTLRMEAGGLSDRDIYVNFDYAIYSFDDAALDPPPSSSNPPPPSSSRDPTPSSSSSSSSQQSSSSRSDSTSSGPTTRITSGPSLSFSGILPPSSSSVLGIGGDGASGDSRGDSEDTQSGGTSIGGIVGGVVGGLAALGLLAFLLLCFLRRRKRERGNMSGPLNLEDQGFPPPQPPMQSRNQATYSQAFNAVGYGNPTENPFMPAPTQGQGEFHQAYSASGYGSAAPVAAGYAGSQGHNGSQGYAGSQSTEYNPYNAPAVGHSMPASHTEGSVYSSPYGGIAGMGSQSSRSQDPSSDFSHRRLVALNPDQSAPLVVAGLTQQDQVRRARQEELDRQMATVQSEMHELDRDLKRGTSVRRRTIPRNAEVEERDMTIEEMQQQMEMMRQQIEILRENQRSDWAAGLTNEPPPGYTADPVQWSAAARSPVPPLPTHAIPITSS